MNKKILNLAIPNIISNLTVPLLSSVDTALMGHLDGVYFLGAIAVGGMIFNFIYWGFGFLRMGTTGLTAQAYGQNDQAERMFILARALTVALFFSLILILLRNLIIDTSLWLVAATPEVEANARLYFSIRIFAAPATLSLYAFTGWFLGMQNARYPLILALVTNLVNIVCNLAFIKLFNMDVDGVAWGTVVANYTGVLTAVFLYRRRYATPVVYGDLKAIFELTAMKRFFRVGRDIFIRTLVLIFAFSFFTATSAGQGDMVLAANSILINLWTIMAYGIDGFAFAAESLIGRYMGARDRKQLQSAIRHIFAWGLALGILFSAAFSIFPENILAVFTNKPEVIALALSMMIWTQAAPLISTICYVWDGVYIGATATRAMRNTMIISLAVFYLPVYYLLQPLIPHHALWLALVIFMLARGVTLSIYYKKEILGQLDNTPLPDRVNTL